MDALRRNLLEDPLWVYAALALVELVIAGLWHRERGRRLAMALLVPPLLAGAVFCLDAAVQTDRERLRALLKDLATHLERGEFDRAAGFLADDFEGFYSSRELAIEAARRARTDFGVQSIHVTSAELEMKGPAPTVRARTVILYRHPTFGAGRHVLDWVIHWGRRDGQWRIVNVEAPLQAAGL